MGFVTYGYLPQKQIIGFTCGSFDLLHTGHVRMLREAKTYCTFLIVGLQEDPSLDRPNKNKPVQSVHERLEVLQSNKHVDMVIRYTTQDSLVVLLQHYKNDIDIRFLGADHIGNKLFTGHEVCNNNNIEIVYTTRNHTFSSSELRDRVWKVECTKRLNVIEQSVNQEI